MVSLADPPAPEFSVAPKGNLAVTIIAARNIIEANTVFGGSDAYAKAGLGMWKPEKPVWDYALGTTTGVVKKSTVPTWNASFDVPVPANSKFNTLHVVVWSKNTLGEDTWLGEANVNLVDIYKGEVVNKWYPLTSFTSTQPDAKVPAGARSEHVGRGEINISIKYDLQEETLMEKTTSGLTKGFKKGLSFMKKAIPKKKDSTTTTTTGAAGSGGKA